MTQHQWLNSFKLTVRKNRAAKRACIVTRHATEQNVACLDRLFAESDINQSRPEERSTCMLPRLSVHVDRILVSLLVGTLQARSRQNSTWTEEVPKKAAFVCCPVLPVHVAGILVSLLGEAMHSRSKRNTIWNHAIEQYVGCLSRLFYALHWSWLEELSICMLPSAVIPRRWYTRVIASWDSASKIKGSNACRRACKARLLQP